MKYAIAISQIIRLCSLSFFNDNDQVLYYNVAVYILAQSEEYSLISKVKPLTIQTEKGEW